MTVRIINFAHVDLNRMTDLDRIFDPGPIPSGYRWFYFDDRATLAHLAVKAGLHKTLKSARESGWTGKIRGGLRRYIADDGTILRILNVGS